MVSAASDSGAGVAALVGLLLIGTLYFTPSIVAGARHHHQAGAVFVLNLLLGWTLIGWVVALVMAVSAKREPMIQQHYYGGPPGYPPPGYPPQGYPQQGYPQQGYPQQYPPPGWAPPPAPPQAAPQPQQGDPFTPPPGT